MKSFCAIILMLFFLFLQSIKDRRSQITKSRLLYDIVIVFFIPFLLLFFHSQSALCPRKEKEKKKGSTKDHTYAATF
jgi:hypothetical protein